MIRKIIAIKNVGRFRSYSAIGDVEFRRLTIIFGENGRGKTTLSAIFRSLKTGSAAHNLERRTISSPDQPHIHFLLLAGKAEFRDGTWDSSIGVIEVFDDNFVHRNLYAGDCFGQACQSVCTEVTQVITLHKLSGCAGSVDFPDSANFSQSEFYTFVIDP